MERLIRTGHDLAQGTIEIGLGAKLGLLATVAGLSGWFSRIDQELVIEGVLTLLAVAALVLYRLKRKFKAEPIRNRWDLIDRNIVELALVLFMFREQIGDFFQFLAIVTAKMAT